MPSIPLRSRPENERVFFTGVTVSGECCAAGAQAERWRALAPEWVRPLLGPDDWREEWPEGEAPVCRWAIDFPPGEDERAVAQAGEVGRVFQRAGGRIVRRGPLAELRIALAKCDRYLAAPAGGLRGRWRWVPAATLPVRGLVVAVRDDEFLAGVLGSAWLEVWLRGTGCRLGVRALHGLPLPWAADTRRGTLTREQEERRAAVVQAWRAAGGGMVDLMPGSATAQDLAAAVAAAYGWPAGLAEGEALRRLLRAT